MDSFNFVIFGFTSNLAQIKIIPALYDLEEKGLLLQGTKIIGIGRKDVDIPKFVGEILSIENRHHLHKIDENVKSKLIKRITYLQEDFEKADNNLYQTLKNYSGNTLYYLATFPNLYANIFQSLKDNGLNKSSTGWVRIMIEKPFGNNLESSKKLNNLLTMYFSDEQIYRVDHYLGKEALRKIFDQKIDVNNLKNVEVTIFENFGIGKRGMYYDSVGALIDVGQNHLLQMTAAIFSRSTNSQDRAMVISNLSADSGYIKYGQYEGYLMEENVNRESNTDTFFAINAKYQGIPVYISFGKFLHKNEAKVVLYFKDSTSQEFIITPLKVEEEYDPYERLIIDAVNGQQTFFNSEVEIEASWKFIDSFASDVRNPIIYKKGSDPLVIK